MLVYATPAEYAEWLGKESPPAGALQALRAASINVNQIITTAVYDVDAEGHPLSETIRDALRDATCAQAEYARATGDANNTGGLHMGSVQIGTVMLTRSHQPPSGMPERFGQSPIEILQQAGLFNPSPTVRG